MKSQFPLIQQFETGFSVFFDEPSSKVSSVPVGMVLDFSASGELLGIEIINLCLKLGDKCIGKIKDIVPQGPDGIRSSYDRSSDCFYLSLQVGSAPTQRAITGNAYIDEAGQVVGFSVDLGYTGK